MDAPVADFWGVQRPRSMGAKAAHLETPTAACGELIGRKRIAGWRS